MSLRVTAGKAAGKKLACVTCANRRFLSVFDCFLFLPTVVAVGGFLEMWSPPIRTWLSQRLTGKYSR